ncbi:MAG TPA: hypothetical protein VGF33_02115 [Caulobacteraceae bacterium]
MVSGALRRAGLASPNIVASGPGVTIPYWTTNITSPLDHKNYYVSMVGSTPYALVPANTKVTYVPVVIRIHLGGHVIDPTAAGTCDATPPATRFFNSPLFVPNNFVSNGVNVTAPGGSQFISAFQRANFWKAVKGTNYGVTLVPSRATPIVVDWSPTNPNDLVLMVSDNCGGHLNVPVPVVDINEFGAELQAIAAANATPNQIPVSLALDTAIYVGLPPLSNCCVLGYHNAISVAGGTQTYAVGAYFDTNHVFGSGFADTTIWSHELGELIDDPFVQSIPGVPGGVAGCEITFVCNNDVTPNWGHTGQVFGCQGDTNNPPAFLANLEVGDPLTPGQVGSFTNYPVTGVGGFVYHYQDLAFHDWFYRTPSSSTGGLGSFVGNLAGGGQPTICM